VLLEDEAIEYYEEANSVEHPRKILLEILDTD